MPDFANMSNFRPLGRFRIDDDNLMHSPDSFHVLALTTVLEEIPPEVVEEEGEIADEASESDEQAAQDTAEANPNQVGMI